ncbi:hypothetical protein [Henriciella sp.]|uniref:hypothetical protein n=1 Tax=Henriciella sp. TaxID=1968823 RepID=UPI0026106C82|nr:hypothetical protein [Henriciella sp.]
MRDFDFARLSGIDSVGMNAAYRYWKRIDWRPTHYVCLDDALIDTHHAAIADLIKESRIESFFLSGRILEYDRELARHEKLRFLDEFVPHWHSIRGKAYGLDFHDEAAFRTSEPNLLTTGAYAARYAVLLGYETIGLFGIDLRYAAIDEATPLEGARLRMSRTPKTNPNYFFDDYQQEGDLFHVPNPEAHERDLHLEAFRALRDDFADQSMPARIFNTNAKSRLSAECIFPYCPAQQFLNEPAITSVIIPVTEAEIDQLMTNLDIWSQPSGAPWLGPAPKSPPALVFVFNNQRAADNENRIREKLESHPHLRAGFGSLRFINLALAGDADLYERSNQAIPGAQGLRAGPNNLFFGAMEAVADLSGHSIYLETDCVPIRADWLGAANRLLESPAKPWISGSIYLGHEALGSTETRHINGNAVYASGDPDFQEFMNRVWKPHMAAMLGERPELPFDCAVEDLFQRARSQLGEADPAWQSVRWIAHRMQYSLFIANLAGEAVAGSDLAARIQQLVESTPETHFIHSRQLADIFAGLEKEGIPPRLSNALLRLRGEKDADGTPAQSRSRIDASQAGAGGMVRRLKQGLGRIGLQRRR